mmetsp:Transcript_28220/g.67124  ORF Transcript_28220/g.67124 Transcript_28220/m.67124 type:complete len:337 (-) Transcript_28220:1003-2013(-)
MGVTRTFFGTRIRGCAVGYENVDGPSFPQLNIANIPHVLQKLPTPRCHLPKPHSSIDSYCVTRHDDIRVLVAVVADDRLQLERHVHDHSITIYPEQIIASRVAADDGLRASDLEPGGHSRLTQLVCQSVEVVAVPPTVLAQKVKGLWQVASRHRWDRDNLQAHAGRRRGRGKAMDHPGAGVQCGIWHVAGLIGVARISVARSVQLTWSAGRRSPSSRRSQRRSRGRCRHSGRCIRAPPGRGCSAMGRRPLLVKAEVGCMFSQVACRGCQCFGGILDAGLPSQFCQCFAGVRIDGNRIAQTRRLHVDREVCFRKEGLYRSEHFPHGDRGPSSKVVDI